MKVLFGKRKELSQTILSLLGSLRTEKRCRRCDKYKGIENELCILTVNKQDMKGDIYAVN
jgi:hypothetical protein